MHRCEYEFTIFKFIWLIAYDVLSLDILNIINLGVCLVFKNKQ